MGVDGEYGETSRWSKLVLYGLGLSVANWNGLAPQARVKARHPETRTAHELAAARARRDWRERLARKHAPARRGKKAALAYAKKHADRRTAETRVNGGPYIDDWCRLVHLQPGTSARTGAARSSTRAWSRPARVRRGSDRGAFGG